MKVEAIEVSTKDLRWRKSSRSSQDGSNGNCVEVAFDRRSVLIRDSKSPGQGNLIVAPAAWISLLHVSQM